MKVSESLEIPKELEMTDNHAWAASHRMLFAPVRFADYCGRKDKTFGVISHQSNESVSRWKPLDSVAQMTYGPVCRWFFDDLG